LFAFIEYTGQRVAEAAELSIRPGMTVSEEYNDNVFLTNTDRTNDYVTSLIPALDLNYRADPWSWDLQASYAYRYYAQGSRKEDTALIADLRNRTEVIKKSMFVEMRDEYNRVSLDNTRDFTSVSEFVNQSDRNVFTLNPYIVLRPDSFLVPIIGYAYVSTWYKEPTAIDTVDHVGYAEVTVRLSSRATISAGARFTRSENDITNYDRSDVFAGTQFTYAQNSRLYGTVGINRFDLIDNTTTSQIYWNAGMTHRLSSLTVTIDTGLSYIPDPTRVLRREDRYVGTIRNETGRTTLAVSGGLLEYRGAITNVHENTTYFLNGSWRYALTPRSSVILNLIGQRFKYYAPYSLQDLYQSGLRIEHRVTEQVTVALQYRYSESESTNTSTGNYFNNRTLVSIAGRF